MAPDLEHDYRGAGRTRPVAAGNRVHQRHLCPGEKGASDIGPTKRHLRVAVRGVCQAKGDGPPATLCGGLKHPHIVKNNKRIRKLRRRHVRATVTATDTGNELRGPALQVDTLSHRLRLRPRND